MTSNGKLLAALGAALCGALLPSVHEPDALAAPSLVQLRAPGAARVWFPAGSFIMGSSPEEVLVALTTCAEEPLAPQCPDFSNEQPRRTVSLSAFGLDTQEVSLAKYERCVAARRCAPLPYHRGARRAHVPDLPAVMVSHRDAESYCAFVGGQLPTEAQFERAARGLARRTYPWGNGYHRLLSNHGRLAFNPTEADDGFVHLAPTSAYADGSTPEGVLNLAGNAAEWIRDSYSAYYDEADTRDPSGPDPARADPLRVVRGGSYLSPRALLRGAARHALPPDTRRADLGFRCAYSQR